ERRFETTREMLTAIEATPFSERDRLESERILQHLVQGRTVAKIAMRALPPLADMPTLAMGGQAVIPRPPRRLLSTVRWAGLTALEEAARLGGAARHRRGAGAGRAGQHGGAAGAGAPVLRAARGRAGAAAAPSDRLAQLAVRGDGGPARRRVQVSRRLSRARGETRLRGVVLPRGDRAGSVH